MKISVQNLGPIKEGTIDLSKNLTVFCGPNGTGKTFMSMLIHEYYFSSNGYAGMKIIEIEKYKILNEQINKKAEEGGILEIEIDINIEILKKIKSDIINKLINPNNLKATYGLDETAIEKFTKNLKIEIQQENLLESFFNQEIKEKEIEILHWQYYKINISKKPFSNLLTIHFPTNFSEIEKSLLEFNTTFKEEISTNLILSTILDKLYNNFKFNSIFFLRPDIQNRDLIYNIPFLPNCFKRNSFNILGNNKILRKIKSHYYDLVVELEAALIGGSLFYSETGEIMFKNNRTNEDFAFNLLSSSIKSLSKFILYLKHNVIKNETIIIDEPEMKLHSDTEVMFARIIARLINAGLKFIISTHSDFILREFNNLIEVSFNDETKNYAINNLQYKKDEYINTEDINLFYFNFKDNDPKSIITQIPVDEYGFSLESVEIVVDKLNDETYKLYKIINFGLEELLNEENNPNEYKQNIKESSKLVAENGAEFNK